MLETVGQWAVDSANQNPRGAVIGLGMVAAVKGLAAIVPVVVDYGVMPWRRLWRVISWCGSGVLIIYGGLNTTIASAVLLGIIQSDGGYDHAAMVGHTLLWDPLFFCWGAALGLSLWFSRRG